MNKERINKMKKKLLIMAAWGISLVGQAQSLETCQQAARQNYPLIKQYDLIAKTTDLTIRNIQKGWLPQVQVSAQGTAQNAVTAWPERIKTVYRSMGIEMKGIGKTQYRVGVDVQQTLYDGGMMREQSRMVRNSCCIKWACDCNCSPVCTAFSRSAFTFSKSLTAAMPFFTIAANWFSLDCNRSCISRLRRICS